LRDATVRPVGFAANLLAVLLVSPLAAKTSP
jgi:hypothetical protein